MRVGGRLEHSALPHDQKHPMILPDMSHLAVLLIRTNFALHSMRATKAEIVPVRHSSPFLHSGVDYAGPFEVKARGGRCKIIEKKYVAVFVCMATKAVHLELVDDLSIAAFIAAFPRFTGVRGSCTHLWSDNGTCFIGAEKELANMVNS